MPTWATAQVCGALAPAAGPAPSTTRASGSAGPSTAPHRRQGCGCPVRARRKPPNPPPNAAAGLEADEHFVAYSPGDPGGAQSIDLGSSVFLVSAKTRMFCRLALYTGGSAAQGRGGSRSLLQMAETLYGMLGDQPTAATATEFVYSSFGLQYEGQAMVAQATFYPLLWSNTSTLSGTGTFYASLAASGAPRALPGRAAVQLPALAVIACACLSGVMQRHAHRRGGQVLSIRARCPPAPAGPPPPLGARGARKIARARCLCRPRLPPLRKPRIAACIAAHHTRKQRG
jgi:hypothetical protein